ncbi:DUF397 domain-containing protein [Streptomyces samsunensis]|uniref:DUF397 domain-containing protein n=1 Tax=Streptomyces malaysiensis TaxID=92644 RepID=UPI00158223D3|nr:DUF397 domain-containing protein [Streptomyces samsunensis]NUH43811.1 DUF397 domain-containing protein [Streptomyces samsunensis]WPB91845.1 DUF397 domain-containing protein [Streptomyces malaysiensis]
MRESFISKRDSVWFKSSYSGAGNTECVEVAFRPGSSAVRDSKDPGGPVIGVSHRAWANFVMAVRDGQLG